MREIAIVCCFILGALFPVAAQYDNVWMFSGTVGIDFNGLNPVGISTNFTELARPKVLAGEGSASVCDRNGQLLFYTEGTFVVDRQHNKMPNGDNLAPLSGPWGNSTVTSSTSQGTIIVPIPGQDDKYYIFSLTSMEQSIIGKYGWLFYSVVDMSLNGGLGDVVVGQKGILLDSNLTEGMTAVAGANCNIWLVTFGRFDRQFRAFSISSSELNPVSVRSGSFPGVYHAWPMWLAASPDRTKFVMAGNENLSPTFPELADTTKSGLFLFDFDAGSGVISNVQQIDKTGIFPCFSPNSKVLYAGGFQYNLSAGSLNDIINSKFYYPGDTLAWGLGKKLASNGKIYFWDNHYGSDYAVINFPDELGLACKPEGGVVHFPSGTFAPHYGVPNVIVHIIDQKDTVYSTTKDTAKCFIQEHAITAVIKNGRKFKWNTGDSTSSLKVKSSGTYWVGYYVECTYYIDSFAVYFPSSPLDFEVQPSCSNYSNGRARILKTGGDTTTYFYAWRAETDTLVLSTVDSLSGASAGKYIINVTSISGCRKTITLTIPEGDYQVSFSADTLLCAGDTVFFRNTSDDHFQTWYWSFGDSTSSFLQQDEHVYREEGRYRVILVGEGPLCKDTAYTTISVDAPAKDLSFEVTPYAICQGATIHFKAKMTKKPVYLLWDLGDENKVTTQSVADMQHAYDNSGVKRVMLKASYRICPAITYQDSIVVYALPKIDLGPDSVLCLNGSPLILKNHRTVPGNLLNYLWSTGETTETITALHPGIYSLTLSEAPLGCSSTETIEVKKDCYTDVPNVFTPNGDGLNDYFFPRQLLVKGIKTFRMAVFNRWGGKVFETHSMEGRGWDGNFNDQPQLQGVYVYKIEIEFDNNRRESYDGNITLLR